MTGVIMLSIIILVMGCAKLALIYRVNIEDRERFYLIKVHSEPKFDQGFV